MTLRLLAVATLLAAATCPAPARADTAECTEITSLPALITTQGVYCLKQSFWTDTQASGAIRIGANNVTLDCNGNQILATAQTDRGIEAINRQNTTIRNCVVTGFNVGIQVSGGGGLVEDNTVLRSRSGGIQTGTGPSVVRRNLIVATGGVPTSVYPYGISVSGTADVLDNTIAGVTAHASTAHAAVGIKVVSNDDGEIAGNRIWGVQPNGQIAPYGIGVTNSVRPSVRGNDLLSSSGGEGVSCPAAGMGAVTGNRFVGWTLAVKACGQDDNDIVD